MHKPVLSETACVSVFVGCVSVGNSGEIWLPAKDGKPGEGMEKAVVHLEKWRDPVL